MFIYQFLGRHIRDTLLVFQQLNEVSHTDIVFSSEWGCQVLVHCVYAKIQIFLKLRHWSSLFSRRSSNMYSQKDIPMNVLNSSPTFHGENFPIWTMTLHYKRLVFVLKRLSLYRKEISCSSLPSCHLALQYYSPSTQLASQDCGAEIRQSYANFSPSLLYATLD